MASDFDDSDGTDDSLLQTKIIKSAYDSESFDADGSIYVEGLVGSATISPSGRDIALASPEGLSIIDLDSPYSAPRRVKSHGMPWLVVDVQWSPFAARDYWVASTANHCCLVWNLNRPDDSSAGAVEHSLRGHRRSITDINFSAHHPDMLSTCSVDGYVHCWDLRRPGTPALTFIDWAAGATQVKYNRQDAHVLASSHNRCVHVWDDRKAALPLRTIEAHTSKIYGLDWNRADSTRLVTCSLDKTIKFWDYTVRGGSSGSGSGMNSSGGIGIDGTGDGNYGSDVRPISEDDVPERVIQTKFPIWRARHTPFGTGLLVMPQTAPGNLYLYDARTTEALAAEDPSAVHDPLAVFPGHGHHKVKEFLWRTRGGIEDGFDNREFQLVSWGDDNKLRLRRVDGDDLATVGYQRGRPAPRNLNLTRTGAVYRTFRILEDLGDYEKRNATMSSLPPAASHRGTLSLPASQGHSRHGSQSPDGGGRYHSHHHHSHHHHHHHHHHQHHQQLHGGHHQLHHIHQRSQHHSPRILSPALPLPRSLSSSNVMRDAAKSPVVTPQRNKFDQRPSWRNQSMTASHAYGRTNPDQSNVQLDWMKGVTMNRRKTSTDPTMLSSQEQLLGRSDLSDPPQDPLRRVSNNDRATDSALSSPLQLSTHDASVSMNSDRNDPESIQEEIVRITDKLPRIKWEDVDMDNLAVTASMTGPWGADGQPIFLKVRVVVPPAYPASRAPRFHIENSSFMPEPTRERIAADLLLLTTEYLQRRRNCLLVAFRYLLGELTLPACLALLDRGLTSSRLTVGDDDDDDDDSSSSSSSSSSSDDDDDNVGGVLSPLISIDAAHSSFVSGPSLPLPPPPPPRSCGAYFTRDGRVVSFFLTKAGKASAKIMFEPPPPPTPQELAELERPVFIGFGKVLPSRLSAARRRKIAANGVTEAADWYKDTRSSSSSPSPSSDESDAEASDSDSSSSSDASSSSCSSSSRRDSSSFSNLLNPWSSNMNFQRKIVRGKAGRRRKLLGALSDHDDDNDASDSMNRSGLLDPDLPVGPKSTVAIEDMRPHLPSKRDLGREYAIFGDGADVCAHNARIADKYGDAALATVWRYAALLLKSDVPLKLASTLVDGGRRRKSVLVIAREAVAQHARTTTAEAKNLEKRSQQGDTLSGRVKWGLHPLARDFVDDLFDYFERLADVQMLAMLSCIFGESFEEDSVAYAESHLSKPDTPLPMKAPSFSLDYVPTRRGFANAVPPPPPLLLLPDGADAGFGFSSAAASKPGAGSSSNNSSAPTAVYYDALMDPSRDDDDEEYDSDFAYDFETAVWDRATGAAVLTTQNNSYSGGETTPPTWFGGSAVNGGSGASGGMLSSSPSFGMAASRFFRRGNNAVVSAIAAGIPQTLMALLSSSPNDRSGGSGGLSAAPTPPPLSRQTSFFDANPAMSQRPSPHNRNPLPHAVQPLGQAYRQILLHSSTARRDIPYASTGGGGPNRLARGSTSTSPRTTGLGKLASSLSSSPQDHAPVRKRPSPAETILGNLTAGNFTWAASALFGGGGGGGSGSAGPPTEPGTAATSVSDEGRKRELMVAAAAASAAAKGARAQAEAAAAAAGGPSSSSFSTAGVAVGMHVRTCNDHLFDDDGWMVASLLGGRRRRRLYAEYRYAYSELLQVWSEPLARLEVLKFNVLREDAVKAATQRNGSTSSSGGGDDAKAANVAAGDGDNKKNNTSRDDSSSVLSVSLGGGSAKHDRLLAVRDSGRGLDVVGICPQCELQLEPLEYGEPTTNGAAAAAATTPTAATKKTSNWGGGVVAAATAPPVAGRCRRCRRARTQLRCVYCTEPVDAIFLPCFGCGCASHPRCLQAWYDAGERLCPAGDECACSDEATSGRVESWTAMQAQLLLPAGARAADREGPHAQDEQRLQVQQLQEAQEQQKQQQQQEQRDGHRRFKSRGLIAQARRSAHYASSSSSAVLVSPYGQHYHAGGDGDGGGVQDDSNVGTGGGGARSHQGQPTTSTGFRDRRVSAPAMSDYNDVVALGQGLSSQQGAKLPRAVSKNNPGAGTSVASSSSSSSAASGATTGGAGSGSSLSSGFWGSSRRARPAAPGLRQQLQQQQYEQQQQQQQQQQPSSRQPSTQSPADRSPASNVGERQKGALQSFAGATPLSGGHLSAARMSLSSRLLRSSTLRRQANSGSGSGSGSGRSASLSGSGRGTNDDGNNNDDDDGSPHSSQQGT
ncbi:WD repeat protein [Niveomyces insectorum RCEF 264]|uniref:WD repeat protein n=1 Tax=Niveomyces insectorum RCEF 264 TaxID=1081102 RepID=A0A162ML73_9HYPO|nr:WD repeat protein [Niveomyces insectorum RCEF 264]